MRVICKVKLIFDQEEYESLFLAIFTDLYKALLAFQIKFIFPCIVYIVQGLKDVGSIVSSEILNCSNSAIRDFDELDFVVLQHNTQPVVVLTLDSEPSYNV